MMTQVPNLQQLQVERLFRHLLSVHAIFRLHVYDKLHEQLQYTIVLKRVPSAISPCSSSGNRSRSKPRKGTTASLVPFSFAVFFFFFFSERSRVQSAADAPRKRGKQEGGGDEKKNNQSMWSWKMRRTYPGYPSSWVAQKGQAAWRPLVPCGMDTEAQYLTVFSEAMWPHGLKAWFGGSLST